MSSTNKAIFELLRNGELQTPSLNYSSVRLISYFDIDLRLLLKSLVACAVPESHIYN